MTGFGKATKEFENKIVNVEIRSLNSKNLDLNIRLSSVYRDKEHELKSELIKLLERGKVDLNIDIQSIDGTSSVINHALFASYSNELNMLCAKHNVPTNDILRGVLTMPNIYLTDSDALTEDEWTVVNGGLTMALQQFNTFRKDEGAILKI